MCGAAVAAILWLPSFAGLARSAVTGPESFLNLSSTRLQGPWQLGELGLKYMKTIKTSSIHLASMINDILDAAAANKGNLAIKLERVGPSMHVHSSNFCFRHA